MDLLTVKQNGEHTGSIGLSGQNTTEIQRFLAADTLLTVNAHNNNINAKRNVPFLLRNLRRRLPSNGTIPRYLKVYNANVKGYDRGIQEHIYKRRKDIRCKLCLTEPHVRCWL